MEDTLREDPKAYKAKESGFVLILVLMEDTLRADREMKLQACALWS